MARHPGLLTVVALIWLVLLAGAIGVRATCEVRLGASQPTRPPGGGGRATAATTGRLSGSFFIARNDTIEGFDAVTGVTQPIIGPVAHGSTPAFNFGSAITGMAYVEAADMLMVASGKRVFRIPFTSLGLFPQLAFESPSLDRGFFAPADRVVYIANGTCVVRYDTTQNTTSVVLGVCGVGGPAVPSRPSPLSIVGLRVGPIIDIVYAAAGLFVVTASQTMVVSLAAETLIVADSPAQFRAGSAANYAFPFSAVGFPQSTGCNGFWLTMNASDVANPQMYVDPFPINTSYISQCQSTSAYAATVAPMDGTTTEDFDVIMFDGNPTAPADVFLLEFYECSQAAAAAAARPPIVPAVSQTSSSGGGSNVGLIVGLVIAGVVLFLIVVAVVVHLTRQAAAAPPTEEEGVDMREDESIQPQRAISPRDSLKHDHSDLVESHSGRTVPKKVVAIRSNEISAMKRELLGAKDGTTNSDGTAPDAAADSLEKTARRVTALSRGDFSTEEVNPVVRRLVRLREWTDDEFFRHNRRCDSVKRDKWTKGKLLGRGANGSVYSVLLPDNTTIAMKEIHLMGTDNDAKSQIEDVEREMRLLESLHHDNLVVYYGVVTDENDRLVRIFMENVVGGSLGDLVRNMENRIPENSAKKYTRQMLRGLAYIHEHGIVHRDMKCDNVLKDDTTGRIKLADFGTAKSVGKQLGASQAAMTMIGTPYFMAPEILLAGTEEEVGAGYGTKADIWSLGIAVAELMDRGVMPWPSFPTPAHAFLHIATPTALPAFPHDFSESALDFLSKCCNRDPRARWSAVQLLRHPWILSIEDDSESDVDDDTDIVTYLERTRGAATTASNSLEGTDPVCLPMHDTGSVHPVQPAKHGVEPIALEHSGNHPADPPEV